jgi:hypothetical protein
MPNPLRNTNTTTTRNLQQMTSAELNRATLAARVLISPLIAPYIADPVLNVKLSDLMTDLEHEADERP